MGRKNDYFFIIIAFVAALAGILFGYDTGVMSGAILFISSEFTLSPELNGLVVGAVLLGALVGSIFSGRITDVFGRKHLLIVVAIIFILSSLGTAVAPNISTLVIGRFCVGIAIGIASYTAPLYISEIAPTKYRGALVSLNQLAVSFGILVSYIVDYIFAHAGSWRWMLGLGVVPAFILLVGMILLPHSPRWILMKGHENLSHEILEKLRSDEHDIEKEFAKMKETVKKHRPTWRSLFHKSMRPALWIGVLLAIIQQVTGINTILYYAPTIFKISGFHGNVGAILATMGIGVIFTLAAIIAIPLVDTLGRKPLLIIGLAGMAIGLALLTYLFRQDIHSPELRWLTLASMLLYIACFGFSLGPVMWLMITEIYPLKIRGLGASVATCMNWASNWVVTASFLTLVYYLGTSNTFLIYLIFTILSILFVIFLLPETKGISLEQIEENLYEGKPWRKLGR